MSSRIVWVAMGFAAGLVSADTLKLKSGRVLEGTVLAGTTREFEFLDQSGHQETFPVTDIDTISFSAALPAPVAATPAPATPKAVTIPNGTMVSVRLIDKIDVDHTAAGQNFRASIDDPVMVNGITVIPRGTDAVLQAVNVEQSGRLKGSDEITLKLSRIVLRGKPIDLATSYAQQKSAGEGKKTTRKVLGGAGLGAIIGGIAGGGTGAAIGAAAGGAGGTALSATGKAHLTLQPETRLQFQIAAAVTIH